MIVMHDSDDVLHRLVQWADRRDAIRALLLTSTRTQPHASMDVFSDYDVVLVVTDIHPLFTDRSWLQDFGDVLVVYWDPISPDPAYSIEQTGNVTQYADGLKIDFRLWPVALLQRIVQAPVLPDELDAGYSVLLDKDQLTTDLRPSWPSVRMASCWSRTHATCAQSAPPALSCGAGRWAVCQPHPLLRPQRSWRRPRGKPMSGAAMAWCGPSGRVERCAGY